MQNYSLSITNVGPHYTSIQTICIDHQNISEILNSEEFTYFFDGGSPYYTYEVSIFGIDGAGNGNPTTKIQTTNTSGKCLLRKYILCYI